jgi:hypothetical protein
MSVDELAMRVMAHTKMLLHSNMTCHYLCGYLARAASVHAAIQHSQKISRSALQTTMPCLYGTTV